MRHPAAQITFDELLAGLRMEVSAGNVIEKQDGHGLSLFVYSAQCTYERAWNKFSLLARGLILDTNGKKTAALTFPKFFNVGEGISVIPDLPFETFEKLDGSLIIIFHHDGKWRTATKGSFGSEQAKWAVNHLPGASRLKSGVTYLCEAIYPANRIVVHYGYEGLVLLGAYAEDGTEYLYDDLTLASNETGWRLAARHHYANVSDLLTQAATLPRTKEGFVLRFADGTRLKIKGDEYCRIHRLVSNLTPLSIWEAMLNRDDLDVVRRELPEEFWCDFDRIRGLIETKKLVLQTTINEVAGETVGKTDREVGLSLDKIPADVRRFVFPWRKSNGNILDGDGRTRKLFFDQLRPTGNVLEGYEPSSSMNRVFEGGA
jgi:RNA ligase